MLSEKEGGECSRDVVVLILIVVEHALGVGVECVKEYRVLILIVVEHALGDLSSS